VATIIRLINFKLINTSLGSALVLLVGRVEHIATNAFNLEVDCRI
jgi:hypothetical protein